MSIRSTPLRSLTLALIVALVACGCGREPSEPPRETSTSEVPTPPSVREYRLAGTVREINRETGLVSIRHEPIPDYMSAMTMPFDLKDEEILGELQVGDKVEGTLRVTAEDSELTDVFITELAESPPLVLDTTGVAPSLRPKRTVLEPGQLVPDFSMTTQDGETLRLSDLRCQVVALTFTYTRCPLPDYCPLMDRKFSELAGRLSLSKERAGRVRLLSISFDPEHDTPEVLRTHARRVGARPPLWMFAVAEHEELRKVADELGLSYDPVGGEFNHTLSTAVIDPQGRLVRLELGNRWDVDELAKTINALARETGAGDEPAAK